MPGQSVFATGHYLQARIAIRRAIGHRRVGNALGILDARPVGAAGRADVVDVVTAVAESETAIQTLVAVRDKVIAAYEEIMRMPV